MAAQQTNIEVIANNIANINTTGFKGGKAEFTDLIYQAERTAGGQTRGAQDARPENLQLGLGVRTAAIRALHTQGSMTKTGNRLDLALNGRGFFQVTGPNGETLYTRAGAFSKSASGQIVTLEGYPVVPSLIIPQNSSDVQVSANGEVSVDPGTGVYQQIGQLTLATFTNEAGLEALGNNLFRETVAAGTPQVQTPGATGVATLTQGYLEGSNVDPVKEITALITAQRSYEMNSKVIQAADEMFSTTSKAMR
jgi:flagellar basal-body rod protein FlgG